MATINRSRINFSAPRGSMGNHPYTQFMTLPILKKNREYCNHHRSAAHACALVAPRADVPCFSWTSPPSTPHVGTLSCTVNTTEKLNSTSNELDYGR